MTALVWMRYFFFIGFIDFWESLNHSSKMFLCYGGATARVLRRIDSFMEAENVATIIVRMRWKWVGVFTVIKGFNFK